LVGSLAVLLLVKGSWDLYSSLRSYRKCPTDKPMEILHPPFDSLASEDEIGLGVNHLPMFAERAAYDSSRTQASLILANSLIKASLNSATNTW